MIDPFDASHDGLRLATAKALTLYDEEELFACLADPDPILRTAAARQLHVRGTRAAFDHATKLLDHARFDRREIGAFVLGQLGTPECPYAADTFERMPRLLEDAYCEVRSAAAGAIGSLASLGRQPPQSLLHRLLALVDDSDSAVRASVAFALGMIADPAARDRLDTMAGDPDPDVREMTEAAIDWHREREPTSLAATKGPVRRKVRYPKSTAPRAKHG